MTSEVHYGTITQFKIDGGYGFVAFESGGIVSRAFFHVSQFNAAALCRQLVTRSDLGWC